MTWLGLSVAAAIICIVLTCIIPTVFNYFVSKLRTGQQTSKKTQILSTPAECRAILNGSYAGLHGKALRQARAVPNQRLNHWFGIQNAFTTSDEAICSAFGRSARELIALSSERWREVRQVARQHMQEEIRLASLNTMDGQPTIKLKPMMQSLTLRIVLQLIKWTLPEQTQEVTSSMHALRSFAEDINFAWLRSKDSTGQTVESNAARLKLIQSMLHSLPPPSKQHDESGHPDFVGTKSPMNFILPAYETMWRVAMLCLLEVRERSQYYDNKDHSSLWIKLLLDFMRSPTKNQLCTPSSNHPCSPTRNETAEMIVKEALRLYPPTRRIYRDFTTEADNGYSGSTKAHASTMEFAADIESCQRTNANFTSSDDPVGLLRFWPGRWEKITAQTTRDEFLAFGATPLQCPARAGFGYMMIALLVAAVLKALGDEWELDAPLNELRDMEDVEVPLKTGRGDYDGFVYKLK